MCTSGISRNIPASHRSLLLDRASDISKWPGERRIKAVVTQGRLRVTYDGQGGYACLRIHPDDDFEERLIAIDRLIEHDRRIARIRASLVRMRLECDHDPLIEQWVDDDMPDMDAPLWSWSVPEEMAAAYRSDTPSGARSWIDRELENLRRHVRYNPISETFGDTRLTLRASAWGQMHDRRGEIELFSVKNDAGILSWNTKSRYLKVRTDLPQTIVSSLEGRTIRDIVEHPFLHPESVIRRARKEKDGLLVELWRQADTLQDAPVRTLDEALSIHAEYRSAE